MADQSDNQTQFYFQPWAVPQQENVKTIIIQQPAETHMNLDASTDKTAIGSFAIAMIIAVVLGGFATWYAYWCAKRSFELTKQSFDSLILQIQSAERSTFESNKMLIDAQNNLKIKELICNRRLLVLDSIREEVAYLTSKLESYCMDFEALHMSFLRELSENKDFEFGELDSDDYYTITVKDLKLTRELIQISIDKVDLMLDPNTELYDTIQSSFHEILKLIFEVGKHILNNQDAKNEIKNLMDETNKLRKFFKNHINIELLKISKGE